MQESGANMDQRVREFFLMYEKANSSFDVSAIGRLYADTFMFGGPHGVKAVKNEDFQKALPRMKAYISSLGLCGTKLQSMEATPLDSKYLLARVVWRMTLRNASNNQYVDASATYVLERGLTDELSIVVQLDHQDLATVIGQQRSSQ
jgi:hypothetical protein